VNLIFYFLENARTTERDARHLQMGSRGNGRRSSIQAGRPETEACPIVAAGLNFKIVNRVDFENLINLDINGSFSWYLLNFPFFVIDNANKYYKRK